MFLVRMLFACKGLLHETYKWMALQASQLSADLCAWKWRDYAADLSNVALVISPIG